MIPSPPPPFDHATPGALAPAPGPTPAPDRPRKSDSLLQDASAWVLRTGVVLSVAVMFAGLLLSFLHHPPTVAHMQDARFSDHLAAIWRGILQGRGEDIIDLGLFLLVLTPIMRVATSVVLFALAERDWFYTLTTLAVLALTLLALLFVH
jgi:uncharacterized membrane protein